MKRYSLFMLILFICLFIIVSKNFAQPLFPKGKWWKHPEVLEKINLTDKQIQKIEKVSDESMRKIIELEARFKIARLDLENLLDQIDEEKLDLNAIEKQIDMVNRIKGELEKERILMLARIRNILPKETIQKLQQIRWKFRKGPRNRRKSLLDEEFEKPKD
jgi:Spy/CpxP family protein refolding chaperone